MNAPELPRDPAGQWWTYELTPDAGGLQLAKVQFLGGKSLVIRLTPDADPATAIPLAVDAWQRRDRRWTKRSDRGGSA